MLWISLIAACALLGGANRQEPARDQLAKEIERLKAGIDSKPDADEQ